MNKNSNTYIIIYSVVMVVLVAVLLSVAALSLQGRQDANVVIEKKSDILGSIGEGRNADKAADKNKYIEEQYARYIVDDFAVDSKGDKVEGTDAFGLLRDLKAAFAKPEGERVLPVFVSRSDDGQVRYIFPVYGSGLWGPVWGYVALKDDLDTISGVVFGHKSETPGLGAEIATPAFQGQFRDKTIFDGGKLVAITVLKGAGASAGNDHAVDAISGGTITSRAVEAMIMEWLAAYEPFIAKERGAAGNNVSNENEEE